MESSNQRCTICGTVFQLRFSFQAQRAGDKRLFFCNQKCHERHLYRRSLRSCSVCGEEFSLVYAYQQADLRGERLYLCSTDCRSKVLEGNKRAAGGTQSKGNGTGAPGLGTGLGENPGAVAVAGMVKKAHKIAVLNQKGGTGKTTTSISLAAGLASLGYRTLLMDLDAQGNVGVSLGVTGQKSLYHVLVGAASPKEAAVSNVRERLDVLPANETLASAEIRLAQMSQGRDRVLSYRMRGMKAYDYVILDCGPSLNLLNQNALTYADQVLIPVSCDYLSLVGVKQILKTLRMVNEILKHPISILGVLPTFYDRRNRISREAVESLKAHFQDKVLPPIRINTRLKEAPGHQQTIYEYASDSRGAEDYRRLVKWLVSRNAGLGKDPWAQCSLDALDAEGDKGVDDDGAGHVEPGRRGGGRVDVVKGTRNAGGRPAGKGVRPPAVPQP